MYKVAGALLLSTAAIVHTCAVCTVQLDQSIRAAIASLARQSATPDTIEAVDKMEFASRGSDMEFRYLVGVFFVAGLVLMLSGLLLDRRPKANANGPRSGNDNI